MKAVLISIKPQWCELIASSKKTVEVRKTRPKLKTPNEPFKVYIYMTAGDAIYPVTINGAPYTCSNVGGKCVIGEFVCDKISIFRPKSITCESAIKKKSCLTVQGLVDYAGNKNHLFGWHISNLKIYDKPKALGNFNYACDKNEDADCFNCTELGLLKCKPVTRPPQSWCYVEVLNDGK